MLATMTEKGQVTVPKKLRDQLGISSGSKLDFEMQEDGSMRVRVLTRGADKLFGLLYRPGAEAHSIEEMDEGIAAETSARNRRPRK